MKQVYARTSVTVEARNTFDLLDRKELSDKVVSVRIAG